MSDYPEHDKLSAISDQSQTIGEFLDMGDWTLCRFDREWDEFRPVSIEAALAEWFGIDRAKIAAEKDAMLVAIRAAAS